MSAEGVAQTVAPSGFPINSTDNLTGAINSTVVDNGGDLNVADAEFNQQIRVIALYVEIILGTIGGAMVFMWLWHNRRRKSRVNALIFHLALADTFVIFAACMPQLIWEYDRNWTAGVFPCKLLKFLQSFAILAATNMVVVLSVDRHQAIRAPLRKPFAVWKMTGLGWFLAGVCSLPQWFVFHVNYNDDNPNSQFYKMTVCEGIFRKRDPWVRQAYLTFIAVINFLIPIIFLVVCYIRIFLKIADKARATNKQTMKPGKIQLQSTPSSSLPKAKIKTLKMAIIIVLAFTVSSAPYFILEMIYSYGDHKAVPPTVSAVIGAMAVANSAVNPYVFLLFNASKNCVRSLCSGICPCMRKPAEGRTYFESTASTRTEYTAHLNSGSDSVRASSKYTAMAAPVELMEKTTGKLHFKN